ncbi:MAG TPA: hypothetical protein VI643_02745 [Planctomycetota bacterium]|nr:hypothetical protein [Planctomycetota bacterium]
MNRLAWCLFGGLALAACAGVDPKAKHEEGMEAAKQNRPSKAISLLREAVEAAPMDVVIHRDYQNLMRRVNRLNEVKVEYRRKMDAEPNSPLWIYLYARLLEGDELEVQMRRCLAADPEYFWGHYGLAVHYKNGDRFVDALRHLEWILKRFKASTLPEDVLITAAVCYSRTSQPDQAARLLGIASTRFAQSPLPPFYLGLLHQSEGRSDEAIRELGESIARDIDFFRAYAPLVQIHHSREEFDKAAALRKKAKDMYSLHPIPELGNEFDIHLRRVEGWSMKVTEKLQPEADHPLEPGTWYFVADLTPIASDRNVRLRYILHRTEELKHVLIRRATERDGKGVLAPVQKFEVATGDSYKAFHDTVITDARSLMERFGR